MSIREIELEMAYTTYDESCKDPILAPNGEPRECRRRKGHPPNTHASGHIEADSFLMWGDYHGDDGGGIKP